MSLRLLLAAAAVSIGAAAPTATSHASGDDARQVLDAMCAARGGDSSGPPYSIARCVGARANKGFDAERLVCDGAVGRLDWARDPAHMNRASWSCVPLEPRS